MEDNLDQQIDSALSGYSSAEPLAGLEQRVLNRVRATEAARRRRRLWALAAVAAATILIAVAARRPQPVPVAGVVLPPARVETAPPSPPAVVRQFAPRPAAKTRRPPLPRALPKRDLFPTPSPLTREERLLLEVAVAHPDVLLNRPVEQIEIKPIEIAPLEIGGGE